MGNDTCASAGQFRTDALIHVHLPPRLPQQQGGEKAGHRTTDHHRPWLGTYLPVTIVHELSSLSAVRRIRSSAPYLSFDQLWRRHCVKSTFIYHLINKIWEPRRGLVSWDWSVAWDRLSKTRRLDVQMLK